MKTPTENARSFAALLRQAQRGDISPELLCVAVRELLDNTATALQAIADRVMGTPVNLRDADARHAIWIKDFEIYEELLLPSQRAAFDLLNTCDEILQAGQIDEATRERLLAELAGTDPIHDMLIKEQREHAAHRITDAERAEIVREFDSTIAQYPTKAYDEVAALIATTHRPARSPQTIRKLFPKRSAGGRPKRAN